MKAGHKTSCSFPLSCYEIDDQRSVYQVHYCNPTKLTIKLFCSLSSSRAGKLPRGKHWPDPALIVLVINAVWWVKCCSEGMYKELYAHKEMVHLTSSSGHNGCPYEQFSELLQLLHKKTKPKVKDLHIRFPEQLLDFSPSQLSGYLLAHSRTWGVLP